MILIISSEKLDKYEWFCPAVEDKIEIGLCWEYCFAGEGGPTDTRDELISWIEKGKKYISLDDFHKVCEKCKYCQWSRG